MMKNLIADFTSHLREALNVGKETSFKKTDKTLENVLICGLGGSGIGGTIISQQLSSLCSIPILVNKDYQIPSFVGSNTLVICCSYSGNTEETLSMYEAAIAAGAEISIITSGGTFAELAQKKGHNILKIQSGLPPRAAFGLSFPQLFFVFYNYGLIDNSFIHAIKNAIQLIDKQENVIQTEAKAVAEKLHGKIPVIYSESSLEGVAVRFRQQINENSKMLCWHHVIPEMNHNELVGWRTENQQLVVVYFRTADGYYRNQARIEQNKDIIKKYTSSIVEIYAKGNTAIEQSLYLIHLGDWVSEFIAQLKGIDSVEVDVITGLKKMLSGLE